jgi:mRNA interferase MazF
MKRGDMYGLRHPGGGDPNRQRVMTVVSRQTLVDSRFPTVVCATGTGDSQKVVDGPQVV